MRACHGQTSGFTLLEVMLAVAFITILASIPLLISLRFQSQNQLRLTTTLIAHNLREAQLRAISGDHDVPWGVFVTDNDVTIFSGVAYANRDTANDIVTVFPTHVSVLGDTEIVFAKLIGIPNKRGSIRLERDGVTPTVISINEKGTVSF